MASEVKFEIGKFFKNLLPAIRKEFRDNQKGTKNPGKPKSDSGLSPGYGTGAHAGSQVDKDMSELKSGRFSGIFEGKAESLKKFKDLYKKVFSKNKKSGEDPENPGAGLGGLLGGKELKELKVRELRVEKLLGNGPLGVPGSPGDKPSLPDAGGESASKLQILGVSVGALTGLALKLGSSLAGMYQGVMQGQDRTLDATGGYMGGGGNLVSNAELASIAVARAQLLGGSARDQSPIRSITDTYSWRDKDGAYNENKNTRYVETPAALGLRFGQSQGIGASAGSELFAKLEKYGGFGGDKNELKKIFADGVAAGFGGLKMQQFVREIANVSENAYKSGLGIQSGSSVANAFSALSSMGVRDERVGSVYNSVNSKFSEQGNLLNSVAMIGALENGGSILDGYVEGEKGLSSSQNRSTAKSLFSSLGPEMEALLGYKQGWHTATEGKSISKSGKSIFDLSVPTDLSKGQETLTAMGRSGQDYRGKDNALNEMIAFSAVAKEAYNAQLKITEAMIKTFKVVDEFSSGMLKLVERMPR
ncbi:hypothetical protein [Leptospira sp. GIMC2001]|uniref:hypothetical protein n=1 Tax=Leptospira sp. GIMC2001 TaxID=1513297 RepID=UPI0023499743|nr:hypothetical protein [Leptospira sp. GIMC2001]WCL51524.1 hypothetical protein O4O04_20115 [Leptospira sp. GIMC2001]